MSSCRRRKGRGFVDCTNPAEETCNIQLLLATNFNNIPRDEATWNELRGATRTIFRACVQGNKSGGIVTENGVLFVPSTTILKQKTLPYLTPNSGDYRNIEIIVYGTRSIYAKNQILKHSTDPLARSIAAQELLELMNLVQVPDQPELEIGALANNTASLTNTSALATVVTSVAIA